LGAVGDSVTTFQKLVLVKSGSTTHVIRSKPMAEPSSGVYGAAMFASAMAGMTGITGYLVLGLVAVTMAMVLAIVTVFLGLVFGALVLAYLAFRSRRQLAVDRELALHAWKEVNPPSLLINGQGVWNDMPPARVLMHQWRQNAKSATPPG